MRIPISSVARSLAAALAITACAGDAPDPVVRKCTKSLYESCITEHDCASEACVTFMAEGYQICTQSCDAARPCPDLGGEPATCNEIGLCQPSAPVECEVVP